MTTAPKVAPKDTVDITFDMDCMEQRLKPGNPFCINWLLTCLCPSDADAIQRVHMVAVQCCTRGALGQTSCLLASGV